MMFFYISDIFEIERFAFYDDTHISPGLCTLFAIGGREIKKSPLLIFYLSQRKNKREFAKSSNNTL